MRQGVLVAAPLVGEGHIVKVDAAVRHFHDGLLRLGQVCSLREHFPDTPDTGHGHADHHHHHGQHHQAHEQGHDVAEQAGEVAGGHIPGHNELRAQPRGGENAEVHRQHHGGVVEGQQALGLDEHLIQVAGGLGELAVLVALPHEGLHHTDGGDVLLDAGVEVVVLLEHPVEDVQSHHHDGTQHYHQEHHRKKEHLAGGGTDEQAHGEAEHKQHGGPHRHTNHHHKGVLHVGDVGGHAGDQSGDAELVDVGKGKGLNARIDGLSEIGGQSGGRAGGVLTSQSAKQQAHQSQHHHDDTVAVHHWQIGLLQPLIHEPCRDEGQEDLHQNLQRSQANTQEGILAVLPELLQNFFHVICLLWGTTESPVPGGWFAIKHQSTWDIPSKMFRIFLMPLYYIPHIPLVREIQICYHL